MAKKPRLFAFPRDIELANLGVQGTPEAELKLLVAALDAFLEIANERSLTPERLTTIVAVAMHPNLVLRGVGWQRLVVMAHYFEEARGALADLCCDGDPTIRAFGVTNLANAPWPFASKLVVQALEDSDWKVRKAAAQVCNVVADPRLAAAVETRVVAEDHPRVAADLAAAKRFQLAAETDDTEA